MFGHHLAMRLLGISDIMQSFIGFRATDHHDRQSFRIVGYSFRGNRARSNNDAFDPQRNQVLKKSFLIEFPIGANDGLLNNVPSKSQKLVL
ncbi:hypothetical protein HMPREF2714_06130 [Corynebacterium sp. HMSC077G01]|nr:hypothetical protein HMPREF2714_06130 [Corynebacterium sp. HMSC077G01]